MFKIKKTSIAPLIFAVSFNTFVYMGSRMIAGGWYHHNIESAIDQKIPLWPPAVIVYLGCYLFWAVNYIWIAQQDKEESCRFFTADFLSRIVCLAFYLLYPTTNTRPQIAPEGFFGKAMLFLYSVDAADNLFPSIHCLVSWFCYIGMRGKKEFPAWYRGFSFFMAVCVCLSTLLTKQHVVIDAAGGILLAELCFWLGKKPAFWKKYEKILDMVNKKIAPEERA